MANRQFTIKFPMSRATDPSKQILTRRYLYGYKSIWLGFGEEKLKFSLRLFVTLGL